MRRTGCRATAMTDGDARPHSSGDSEEPVPPGEPHLASGEYAGGRPQPFRAPETPASPTRFVPLLADLRGMTAGRLRPDLVAGVTIAALAVPQGMAYAQTAGPARRGRALRAPAAGHRLRRARLVARPHDRPHRHRRPDGRPRPSRGQRRPGDVPRARRHARAAGRPRPSSSPGSCAWAGSPTTSPRPSCSASSPVSRSRSSPASSARSSVSRWRATPRCRSTSRSRPTSSARSMCPRSPSRWRASPRCSSAVVGGHGSPPCWSSRRLHRRVGLGRPRLARRHARRRYPARAPVAGVARGVAGRRREARALRGRHRPRRVLRRDPHRAQPRTPGRAPGRRRPGDDRARRAQPHGRAVPVLPRRVERVAQRRERPRRRTHPGREPHPGGERRRSCCCSSPPRCPCCPRRRSPP